MGTCNWGSQGCQAGFFEVPNSTTDKVIKHKSLFNRATELERNPKTRQTHTHTRRKSSAHLAGSTVHPHASSRATAIHQTETSRLISARYNSRDSYISRQKRQSKVNHWDQTGDGKASHDSDRYHAIPLIRPDSKLGDCQSLPVRGSRLCLPSFPVTAFFFFKCPSVCLPAACLSFVYNSYPHVTGISELLRKRQWRRL